MARKMTKDITFMVEEANIGLRGKYMQNNADARTSLTSFISHILLNKRMYHGFNYFVEDEDGNLTLAGKETTLIQFYIH